MRQTYLAEHMVCVYAYHTGEESQLAEYVERQGAYVVKTVHMSDIMHVALIITHADSDLADFDVEEELPKMYTTVAREECQICGAETVPSDQTQCGACGEIVCSECVSEDDSDVCENCG